MSFDLIGGITGILMLIQVSTSCVTVGDNISILMSVDSEDY